VDERVSQGARHPRVHLGDDDLGETFVQDDGMSQIRMATFSNPGVRAEPVSSVIAVQSRVLFSRQVTNTLFFEASSNVEEALRGTGFRTSGGDLNVTSDRFLELRVIDSRGQVVESHRLKVEVLNDMPALFRTLPDKHYALYLVHVETKTSQLVVDVYVRNGKVIDPGDDSEGTRDRPPTEEATRQSEDVRKLETKQPEAREKGTPAAPARPEDVSSQQEVPAAEGGAWSENGPSPLDGAHQHWGPALAGLVATSSFRSWAKRVDRTVAQAGSRQWKRLRVRNPHERKNR